MHLNAHRAATLARVFEHLTHGYRSDEVRERVGVDLMELLGADYFASYIWDAREQRFASRVALNMDDANLRRYEAYYQYHDPITFKLQARREPTLVTEIMPQAELERTEFFNDFLRRDGLRYGVNLYAYDGDRNIGDLRIWRGRQRENFDAETIELLRLVQPAFANAMRLLVGADAPTYRAADGRAVELTEREVEVARLVAEGLTDKVIAARLALAFPTVRTHVNNLFAKFGVHNRASLCRLLLARREH
jgi:DNA-binding CsgD family transcriptional regulator